VLRLSEEPDACYCSGKEHGANSKSQSKGLPCRAYFLAPDFLALDFLVEAFDVGKRLIDAVSGARHWARPPAAVAKFWGRPWRFYRSSVRNSGRDQPGRGKGLILRNTKGLIPEIGTALARSPAVGCSAMGLC
jgi:hypothetical protein